jgi:glycosyltransferase involved in cell wall biosynthesis
MRVAIYHPWIYVKSGLERTIMEIRRRSRHDWTIYTSHYDRDGTYPELQSMGVIEVNRVSVQRRYGAVLNAAWTIARTRLDLSQHDALVVCCDGLGSLINFRNADVPSISLCFTPLRAVYDEEYKKRHVARYGRALRPLVALFETGYRFVDRLAWRRYAHAFCITETVKKRVVDGGLYPADRIDIAYAGVASEHVTPSEVYEPYFFLPGRIMWTKNLELGIAAFRQLHQRRQTHFELVVAGMLDRKSEPYLARLRELAKGLPVHFKTNLSDAEMADDYRRCYGVLFTAFNEDQGLTPLEAGMHGKPVIAVNRGGPTETVIDGVSGYLLPGEADAFCSAMEKLIDAPDEARRLGQGGIAQGRRYTWDAFVERIDAYLDKLDRRACQSGA